MKCPYCGNEMQSGYLQSSRPLVWGPSVLEDSILPETENGGFYVTKGLFKHNCVTSYFCAECGLLLTPLKNQTR